MAVTPNPDGGSRPSAAGVPATTTAATVTAAVARRSHGALAGRRSHSAPSSRATTRAGREVVATNPTSANRCADHSTTRAGRPASMNSTSPNGGATTATVAATNAAPTATTAAGTATRLAGTLARGTSPNETSSSGRTASWAPTVTDSRSATRGGRRWQRARTTGARTTTPAAAVADSSRPSEFASSGSTSTSSRTAPARTWRASRGTPRTPASSATAPTVPARRTEGWNRVRNAKASNPTSSTHRRPAAPSRSGTASARRPATSTATCVPDTAVRWVSPDRRIASRSSSGWSRVSPVTKPTSSPPTRSSCRATAVARNR
jgi:trimeric autotransporter adhesin